MASAARRARNPLFRDLPAIFEQPAWANLETGPQPGADYLPRLLDAFSRVFLAHGARPEDATARLTEQDPLDGRHTLEERIVALPSLADPAGKTAEFLDWLGSWVALTRRIELPRHKKETIIANALALYCIRGTKRYLEKMLAYYLDCGATVDEPDFPSMQIGRASTIGRDTYLGGAPAHFFRVTLVAAPRGRRQYRALLLLATNVIDLSKPAHTWYELRIQAPAMQIGRHSTVGVDTLLTSPPNGGKEQHA